MAMMRWEWLLLLMMLISVRAAELPPLHATRGVVANSQRLLSGAEMLHAAAPSGGSGQGVAQRTPGVGAVSAALVFKRMVIAYLLWGVCGVFGAHHLYLGRNQAALLCSMTFGGCGLGLLGDAFRIPRYVRQLADAEALEPNGSSRASAALMPVRQLQWWAAPWTRPFHSDGPRVSTGALRDGAPTMASSSGATVEAGHAAPSGQLEAAASAAVAAIGDDSGAAAVSEGAGLPMGGSSSRIGAVAATRQDVGAPAAPSLGLLTGIVRLAYRLAWQLTLSTWLTYHAARAVAPAAHETLAAWPRMVVNVVGTSFHYHISANRPLARTLMSKSFFL